MITYIEKLRGVFGVEPICRVSAVRVRTIVLADMAAHPLPTDTCAGMGRLLTDGSCAITGIA